MALRSEAATTPGRVNLLLIFAGALLMSAAEGLDWVLAMVHEFRSKNARIADQSLATDLAIFFAAGLVCVVIVGLFQVLNGRDDE